MHRLALRTTLFLVLILFQVEIVHSKNFYIRTTSGILSVITIGETTLSDAISFSESFILFNEEVLLQFVSEQTPSSDIEHYLAYQLFLLYADSNNFLNDFVESGTGNIIESDFFQNSLTQHVLNEYHNIGDQLSSNEDHGLAITLSQFDGSSLHVTDWPCLYGCGEYLNSCKGRADHHRNTHSKLYQKLKEKCDKGFSCKFCGSYITGIQPLGTHLHRCPKATNYLDYVE